MIFSHAEAQQTLTRDQAARAAQVSVATIDRAIASGQLRVKRVGRRVLITRNAFTQWLSDEQDQLRPETADGQGLRSFAG